jgi:hypothetical protein
MSQLAVSAITNALLALLKILVLPANLEGQVFQIVFAQMELTMKVGCVQVVMEIVRNVLGEVQINVVNVK